ncbi:hypothetical protein A5634_03720 [Mycobacterium asiaticum]|uniref:Uncharacterized protein n=1 Tax=Mycobacterium asiaticum TaxID=1790 RepID=A0A1A3NRB5_MYCAS|nr:hypothetical protein [Mycobacterium asiaticum]OBK24441.1 hypothetical protein A5634_03720 [Mycobacterium asiaticum]
MTDQRATWLRFVIAATFLVVLVLNQCWHHQPHRQTAHPDHPLAAVVGGEFAVNADHAHFANDLKASCPLDIAALPLPRSDATLFAPNAVDTVPAGPHLDTGSGPAAGRGPPGVLGLPRSGQDLLTRYCLARR